MEEISINKNGFSYPKNNAAKAILWSLYPIGVFLMASLFVGVVFGVVVICMMLANGNGLDMNLFARMVADNYGIVLVSGQVVTLAATLPVFLAHRKYLPKAEKCSARTVVLGVMFIVGAFAIIGVLQSLIFSLFSIEDSSGVDTQAILITIPFWVQIITTVILAPIMEEIMFRGIIVNRLMSRFPAWVAVVVSGVAFGVIHMNLYQGIFAGLGGLALGLCYVKTRSLWLCIFAHAANNLYALLLFRVEWSNVAYAYLVDVVFGAAMLIPVFVVWFAKRNKAPQDIDFFDSV